MLSAASDAQCKKWAKARRTWKWEKLATFIDELLGVLDAIHPSEFRHLKGVGTDFVRQSFWDPADILHNESKKWSKFVHIAAQSLKNHSTPEVFSLPNLSHKSIPRKFRRQLPQVLDHAYKALQWVDRIQEFLGLSVFEGVQISKAGRQWDDRVRDLLDTVELAAQGAVALLRDYGRPVPFNLLLFQARILIQDIDFKNKKLAPSSLSHTDAINDGIWSFHCALILWLPLCILPFCNLDTARRLRVVYSCGGAVTRQVNKLFIISAGETWEQHWVSLCFDVLKMIPSMTPQAFTIQNLLQTWKLAHTMEKNADQVVIDACNPKAARRLMTKLLPKLMKVASQPRLQEHVRNRDECCARLAKWLEEAVLSDRNVPELMSTKQQTRKAARKVRMWTKEEARMVQKDLVTLNQCGQAVTLFFRDLFHGNFEGVFELRTNPLLADEKGIPLNRAKMIAKCLRAKNMMDLFALKTALVQMQKNEGNGCP